MKSLFKRTAAGRLSPEEIEHLWGEADFARDEDDFATARRLYRRLANLGQSRALLCLGEMCREGQGEPENFTQAYIYYERRPAPAKRKAIGALAFSTATATAAWNATGPRRKAGFKGR